jgi:flagellin-specific chaperone FliS
MVDQLIVFQKLYDLFVYTHQVVAKFPKSQRFLLSNYLLQANIEMIRLTIIANNKIERLEEQKQISLNLDLFRIYTRLARDINFISIKKYEQMLLRINEIGRLLTAWKKSTKYPQTHASIVLKG